MKFRCTQKQSNMKLKSSLLTRDGSMSSFQNRYNIEKMSKYRDIDTIFSYSDHFDSETSVVQWDQGRVAMQDRARPVSSSASVIGWETRPVLILATGLGFATRPRFQAAIRSALQCKTGRDRSRHLRLWLVERRDRSCFLRPVLDLQRDPDDFMVAFN